MRKKICIIAVVAFALLLAACGGPSAAYKDGEYSGRSSADDKGAVGEVKLTVKDGKIAKCDFKTYQKDGKLKAADYGKVNGQITNKDFYDKAQLAVRAMQKYAEQYQSAQSLDKVDNVTGATVSYNQFKEAVREALEKAKK